jgi:MarR family transcriptional regulator, lower aerobic nicotinate degradation pathway regulator
MDVAQPVDERRAGEFGMLLTRVGRLAEEKFAAALRSTGLRGVHMAALAELGSAAKSQQALGDVTGADPVRLVGILNDLEAEGLIARRRDPVDRRRHIVEISDLGRARLAAAEGAVAAVEEQLLAKLDPTKRRQLQLLLGAIAETGEPAMSPCQAALKADEERFEE